MSPQGEAVVVDCQSCGACCQTAGEVTVGRTETVPKYLTRSVRNMIGFASWEADEFVRMARTSDDRCVALRGEVGNACRCAIYGRRPVVCREFEQGSVDCAEAMAAMATGGASQ
jgi:Fe-S-cluster containining protein